ncbi:histidine kinase [Myroides sp. 1354]|uniref:sensor histidine kinase n=1 Tax=unclassified Myroides TaxID=2642485 RepID=UPI0025768C89|nr:MULTISPECIES: histidine kinase [unclassified Myroides]MDM1045216.1 histidine kinase [Myroides sp. R163-1]MDM1056098.1 histidine kinase [Myroides sp. 1354]MDM1069227.1 histidine kinase [Myroides sp. 1372]
MRNWFGFLLFVLAFPLLYGQTTVTKRYTTEDGLIANDVRALLLDSRGVLWIGSRAGLSVRQQGKIAIDNESLQYRYTNVTSIVEDQHQGIWIGSYGQGILYKGRKKTLLFNEKSGLFSTRINALFVSGRTLYIGTSEGICKIDIPTLEMEKYQPNNILTTPSPVSSFYQIDQTVFATTINHGVFQVERGALIPISENKEVVASIFDVKHQTLVLGLKFDLEIHQLQSDQAMVKHSIKGTRFFQQVEDKVYWVGADILNEGGGIYAWDGKQVEKLNQKYGIFNAELYSLAYDAKRNFLYVGSKKQGLFQVDLTSPLRFDPRFGPIEAITLYRNTVYVFGQQGLCLVRDNQITHTLDKAVFKAYQLAHNKKFIGLTTRANHFFELEHQIPAEQIQFYKAIQGANSIWVSTNIGLFQLSIQGRIENYFGIHTYQYDFIQDKLLETDPYGGVRLYQSIVDFQYKFLDRQEGSFVPRDIVAMQAIEDKMYLAGALDGLYIYENNQFRSLLSEGVFAENRLKFLAKGEGKTLYVATDFGDIYYLDVSGQNPKVIQKIPQQAILGHGITFLHYCKNQLLIGTNRGITVLDPKGTFLFDTEQGLDNYNVKSSAILGNQLILGTDAGLYTLDLDYFKPQLKEYDLVVSSIKVNETKLDLQSLGYEGNRKLVLPYDQNSIFVNFVLLGAKYPEKLRFQYRVKPTEEWLELEQSTLSLNYLNSGEYPIEIKIYDYDKGTVQIKALLDLTIMPPFYYSWWFFSMLVLVGIGIVVLVIQRMKRRQEIKDKQLRYEKKVAELKVLSVRSQLNTHFIFNVLSSFQYFIIAHKEEEALYYLERFASLIRKTLNLSMVEQVSLKDELDYILGYFELENMRLDERVQLEIDLDPQVNKYHIMIPPLLLQPFVENSLVHAFPESIEHPKIKVNVYLEGQDVILEVIDNGIGKQTMPQSLSKHDSKGLFLVKERMKMIQEYLEEHISIESTTEGTRVRLVLKQALN